MSAENAVEESTSGEATPKQAPKKSNGQIFKEAMGYSKSMKRMMAKYYCTTVEQYRKKRKENKKALKAKLRAEAKPKIK